MPFVKNIIAEQNDENDDSKCIENLGKYLKKLRTDSGYSIRYVAKNNSISPSYLSKIENGRFFNTIGINTLVKLSGFYGISISSILEEAGFTKKQLDFLPDFTQYLRSKYKMSPQAIRDLELAKEIIDRKYLQN